MTKETCDNCVWSEIDDAMPHCKDIWNKGMRWCNKYVFYEYFKENKVETTICPVCQRDKDPGKCWWCGNNS